MSEVQQLARRQQRIEELCAGAIRAIAGESDLHFRGRRLHRGRLRLPLFAPHLHPAVEQDDFASFRGAADGLALRLSRSDAALHARWLPVQPVQRLVFDLLEQFRVEALVPPGLRGVRHNLRHRFEQWSLAFHRSRLTDSARGILLFTVAQVCRARIGGEPVLEQTEDLMEATRAALAPAMGSDLAGLRRQRHDQAAFATHALAIAQLVADMLHSADEEDAGRGEAKAAEDRERAAFSLVMELDARVEEGLAPAVSGHRRVFDAQGGRYRIFTTAHDRELPATVLVRADALREQRARLDKLVVAAQLNLPRLARELHALLAQPAHDGWDSALEEGRIDGHRLAQLVASPGERRLFRDERIEPLADCALTVLIDCSGSMKQHIDALAPLVDVFARALEQAGVTSEVLGFTTGAWHGGRALRDWQRAGRPVAPGRLNEVCHIVFKDADMRWRRARSGLAALLRHELFREGIDGEAVLWAAGRLGARSEARRILLVVSDGSPMDGATHLANDVHYLDSHLQQVAQGIERGRTGIELCALGVGLDLSAFYARCQAVDPAAPPGHVLRDLLRLLARPVRR